MKSSCAVAWVCLHLVVALPVHAGPLPQKLGPVGGPLATSPVATQATSAYFGRRAGTSKVGDECNDLSITAVGCADLSLTARTNNYASLGFEVFDWALYRDGTLIAATSTTSDVHTWVVQKPAVARTYRSELVAWLYSYPNEAWVPFPCGSENVVYDPAIHGSAWDLTALNPAAPHDVSGNVAANPTAPNLAYRGTDGRIRNYWWDGSTWVNDVPSWEAPLAASDPVFDALGKIVYTGNYGLVYNLYWTGVWNWAPLSWTPSGHAQGKPATADGRVFYRGTDDKMWHYWWDGSTWQNDILIQNMPRDVAGNPVTGPFGKVFYRNDKKRLFVFYEDGGWKRVPIVTKQAKNVASDPAVNPSGTNVFYRATDGRIRNYWWNGAKWVKGLVTPDVTDAQGVPMASIEGKVLYRRSDGRIHYSEWTPKDGWIYRGPLNPCVSGVAVGDPVPGFHGGVFVTSWTSQLLVHTP